MKIVDNTFKQDIRTYGRQLNYNIKVNNIAVDIDNFNYIKPSFYANLFKTIMHQVEIDTKYNLSKGDKINIEAGVKVNSSAYKYVSYNSYYIKNISRNEDTSSYKIMAYDKMVESMIDYDLEITEKISLREYFIRIFKRLGWDISNIPATFVNSKKLVDPSLHTGIKYTFRMVLDELTTLACCALVFINDVPTMKYPEDTKESIDETYLDEDNIIIGEKVFFNSLVFSRAEESDNIYRKDNDSIAEKGLHEYRIKDNQLLSTNDRDAYIDEMFNYLKKFEFYTFDVKSKGILFLEAYDRFNLSVNNEKFSTLLLNDEIAFDDGLTEDLYMDEPTETQTDYKYSDETDKRINQAYILVDKQNKKITSLTSSVNEQGEKLTSMEQTVDGFTNTVSKIEKDVESVKSTANSSVKKVEVKYSLGDSSTEAPTTGWSTTAPTWTEGKYMWQKTVTTFVDGSVSESNATCIQGAKGADGVDGKDGEKGDKGDPGDSGISAYMHVKYSDNGKRFTAPINNLISTDVNAWENGQYSMETGEKQDYNNRIRLKELLPITSGRYITDTRYDSLNGQNSNIHFVIRCYDKNKKFILTMGENRNGKSAYIRTDVAYLGITLAVFSGSDKISVETYQVLVENGLEPIICKESEYVLGEKAGPYIGILSSNTSVPSTTFDDYTWTEIKGDKGDTGDKGADGKTTYFHIKYSSVANPTASQMTETPSAYIGTYVDYTAKDSTDPTKYTWSRFQGVQGEKGEKGIPGIDGTNGKTSYLHIAYANSEDGKTDFDVSDSTNKTYIGQYTDFIEADSTDPTKYSWTKIKGETGQQGKTGATGKGIKSVQDQYYLSTSNTKQTGGAWKNTQDEWEEGKYIWTRSFITWTDNTTSYTTPCLADSINKANQVASDTAKNLENNYSTTKETKTMIEQEADSIRLEVDTIEKFTRDISSRRELHLVDTADYAENLVLTLKIFGDTEKWKELVPSTSLAPGLTVAPLGTTIDLIVDSQSRLNPSEDKQVFTINYGKKLRSLGNVRDELDIINNKVTVIRRIGLNDSGQEYVLQTEQTEEFGELKLPTLKDNTYIYVREYPNLEYFCRYITDNDYIKKFATQDELKEATVELNTKFEQSNAEILLLAQRKVGKDEVIASINISPEQIKILAQKLQISAEDVLNIIAGNTINLTSRNLIIDSNYLTIDQKGNLVLDAPGLNVIRVKNSNYPGRSIYISDQYIGINTDGTNNALTMGIANYNEGIINLSGNGSTTVRARGITTPTVTQTSTESTKKNFELLEEAIGIVRNGDIYKYNLKIENDLDKKHYGFVIADEDGNFETPEEVISQTGKGIDTYSMTSILWKACQELIFKVEKLENDIKQLKK